MHGYLSSGKAFIRQINYFSKFFNVYYLDLKGFGENTGMPYPYSLDDYILEVKEYIKKNNLHNPIVIAHSFGGRIAIKMCELEPSVFSKLVLVDSAGLKSRFSIKRAIKKIMFRLLKKFIKKDKLKRFYSKDYLALDSVMQKSFIKIINEHLDKDLNKINVPTLIVFGNKDKETPLYMARRLKKGIKNSKLVVIKNAGHFCFIDKSAKFNMEVKEFLLP